MTNVILSRFNDWVKDNRLTINETKTKVLSFDKKSDITLSSIYLNDVLLDYVDSYKLVGITLDSKLTFKIHCSELSKKLRYCVYGLSKIKNLMPTTAKKLAYNGLFESLLTYNCDIWGFTNKNIINPLFCNYVTGFQIIDKTDFAPPSIPFPPFPLPFPSS